MPVPLSRYYGEQSSSTGLCSVYVAADVTTGWSELLRHTPQVPVSDLYSPIGCYKRAFPDLPLSIQVKARIAS
jgi:hypothetical protein